MIRVNWKHVAVALAILPFAAVLFAWIGFFNVGASAGHWKITDWFLHFAMRSAIRTYALQVDLPVEAIKPAAGHFARGCAICHGAPGEPQSPAAISMLPRPPDLAAVAGEWENVELFRIVKYGVRFTGMPAWPTQNRDDEVWAMVAFLRALPEMDAGTYRRLAYGEPGAPVLHATSFDRALAECSRCHGADGRGGGPATPRIAGQREAYLAESLEAFGRGHRASGFMRIPVSAVEPAQLAALAGHFAAMPWAAPEQQEIAPELVRRGEEIAREGIQREGVPACLGCHGPGERNPAYPRIDGQKREYLAGQLPLFRDGKRGGGPYGHLMINAAKGLSDDDIEALAAYFGSRSAQDDAAVDSR